MPTPSDNHLQMPIGRGSLKIHYDRGPSRCQRMLNASIGPTLSVRRILGQKCMKTAHARRNSSISPSVHHHSGQTKRSASARRMSDPLRSEADAVWQTIFVQGYLSISSLSRKTNPGNRFQPHCSRDSRMMLANLSLFLSVNSRSADLCERKNTKSEIQASTPFCRIVSIFSYLFGIAWKSRILMIGSATFAEAPVQVNSRLSFEIFSRRYEYSFPSQLKNVNPSPSLDLRTCEI